MAAPLSRPPKRCHEAIRWGAVQWCRSMPSVRRAPGTVEVGRDVSTGFSLNPQITNHDGVLCTAGPAVQGIPPDVMRPQSPTFMALSGMQILQLSNNPAAALGETLLPSPGAVTSLSPRDQALDIINNSSSLLNVA